MHALLRRYLIQREMEAYLDCPLPCAQLHLVFLPAAAMQGVAASGQAVAVGANVVLVGALLGRGLQTQGLNASPPSSRMSVWRLAYLLSCLAL